MLDEAAKLSEITCGRAEAGAMGVGVMGAGATDAEITVIGVGAVEVGIGAGEAATVSDFTSNLLRGA